MTPQRAIATILVSMIAATWAASWFLATGWIPKWADLPVVITAAILWVGIVLWSLEKMGLDATSKPQAHARCPVCAAIRNLEHYSRWTLNDHAYIWRVVQRDSGIGDPLSHGWSEAMNRLLNAAIVVSVVLAVALYAYYDWQPSDPGPPETEMQVAPTAQIDTWSGCLDDGHCYFCWNMGRDDQECILHGPGPVEPMPKIEDHVAAVMDRNCPACPDCPTWDALHRAGVEIICTNAFGEVPSVNYWPQDMPMACSRIKKIVVTDKRIEVERK